MPRVGDTSPSQRGRLPRASVMTWRPRRQSESDTPASQRVAVASIVLPRWQDGLLVEQAGASRIHCFGQFSSPSATHLRFFPCLMQVRRAHIKICSSSAGRCHVRNLAVDITRSRWGCCLSHLVGIRLLVLYSFKIARSGGGVPGLRARREGDYCHLVHRRARPEAHEDGFSCRRLDRLEDGAQQRGHCMGGGMTPRAATGRHAGATNTCPWLQSDALDHLKNSIFLFFIARSFLVKMSRRWKSVEQCTEGGGGGGGGV